MKLQRRKRRGAAVMEGALVVTVFFMMLFGIVDFGRLVWIYTTLTAAARETSRWAMVHGEAGSPVATAESVQSMARTKATGLEPGQVTATTVWTPDKKAGSEVKVTVTYAFSPLIGSFVGLGDMTLNSTSRVIITQ